MIWAAPIKPLTRQCVKFRAFKMCFRSNSVKHMKSASQIKHNLRKQ